MSMNPDDVAKLTEMQALCTELAKGVKQLTTFGHALDGIDARYRSLVKLYQEDWLRLVESDALDAAQVEQIEAMVAEGEHSILGEEVIWDTLNETHELYTALLKSLAQRRKR